MFIKAKIKCVCPLRGVVLCATCECCAACFWMLRVFCSSLWEGSTWSEWFVTLFWQLGNEMLQCAVNFNISFSAKQISAVNFWEGLLRMGFKRTCLLMRSRFSLMLLFLLSWSYIPFNHIVLHYPEEKRQHLWKHWNWLFVVHHLLDGVSLGFSLFFICLASSASMCFDRAGACCVCTAPDTCEVGMGGRWVMSSWMNTGCLWLHLYKVREFTKFLWVKCVLPLSLIHLPACEGCAGIVLIINKNKVPKGGVNFLKILETFIICICALFIFV